MKSFYIVFGLLVALLATPGAQAQVTVDVAKVTCRQFLLGQMGTSTKSIANWLNGYYHGKHDNTVIEVRSMETNLNELERYCRKHHEMAVMDAAKNVLGMDK